MKKQKMSKKIFQSRKGVSGTISGVFVILICFLALGAIFVYAINLDRYNQVVNERSQLNWDIEEENFIILDGQRNDDSALNLTLFNSGGVTAHIVDIWVTHRNGSGNWQRLYSSDFWINPAETVQNFGEQNVTLLPNGIQLDSINLTQPVVEGINYTVKLVSERGNTVSYLIKYEPPEENPPPPLRYVFGSMQIKYTDSTARNDSDADGWCNPWITRSMLNTIKPNNQNNVTIKINITNTAGHDVNFTTGAVAYQSSTQQGNTQMYVGGIESTSHYFYDGETKEIIFILNYLNDEVQASEPPFVLVGLGAFSTNNYPNEDFLSGAVVLDGLLVVN